MPALLISTYDLGRQPFGLASAAAVLRAAGVDVTCLDLAKQRLDLEAVGRSDAIAFFLPMHTATRLALPVIDRVRAANPDAQLIAYGLYAPLNEALLRERGVRHVIGGEFEDDLVQGGDGRRVETKMAVARGGELPRVHFLVPDRQRAAGTLTIRDACRWAASGAWPATPRRAAAASIAAGTVPSFPSTTAASASSRSRSCWRMSGGRSRTGRGTSRSAIPISSTARVTRASW